jgi:lysyl-tRNA synthetase class 2
MPSTVIRNFCYHARERKLEIVFVTGRRYVYHNVPLDIFEAMSAAASRGRFFNAHVRDNFHYTRER